jgi:hypothetical protein
MIDHCKLLTFPLINEQRGSLSFIEANVHVPFSIQRVYYLSDIPKGASRGAHAHKSLQQVIIPITGSFDVHIDDGANRKFVHLNSNSTGLYIGPMIWRVLDNFSPGAVGMVLASEKYNEEDYYRNRHMFLAAVKKMIK